MKRHHCNYRAQKMWAVAGMVLLGICGHARALNATVANVTLDNTGGQPAAGFDLNWDKSWRDADGHDACWVFIKHSNDGGKTWQHADLSAAGVNPKGFSTGAGSKLEIMVPSDKKGAFIRRAENGTGTVSATHILLPLDTRSKGAPNPKSQLKVFAVEMVYSAKGAFYLGTPGIESGRFHDGADSNKPFQVKSEGAITIDAKPGCLWCNGDHYENQIGPVGKLPAAFPKGFDAFYLMKMEISQRQYCDFLNTLNARQQKNRHEPGLFFEAGHFFNKARNYIKKTKDSPAFFGCDANTNAGPSTNAVAAKLNEADDGEWVACSYLSWMDLAAWLDWAALRPMTELEFEKACRGPLPPVANEYAWGDTILKPPAGEKDLNTSREVPVKGNCSSGGETYSKYGPFRSGSFADIAEGRTNIGAAYCGALDMSGNMAERSVTVGNPQGRVFTGLHGDGNLSENGHANVEAWPGLDEGEVIGAVGIGTRGGHWLFSRRRHKVASHYLWTSDRGNAVAIVNGRYRVNGGRGARTAP